MYLVARAHSSAHHSPDTETDKRDARLKSGKRGRSPGLKHETACLHKAFLYYYPIEGGGGWVSLSLDTKMYSGYSMVVMERAYAASPVNTFAPGIHHGDDLVCTAKKPTPARCIDEPDAPKLPLFASLSDQKLAPKNAASLPILTMVIPKPGVKSLVYRESGYDICVLQMQNPRQAIKIPILRTFVIWCPKVPRIPTIVNCIYYAYTILKPPKYCTLEPGSHVLNLKIDLQIARRRFRWRRSGNYENPLAIAAPILAVSEHGADGGD
ncbi:hypothetical protein EDD85DRAFT_795193 [Armillaria nabsnona]|nr:hypothetical protein EDD85DRAFT_795193 [Armillaria nabsnona]